MIRAVVPAVLIADTAIGASVAALVGKPLLADPANVNAIPSVE